MEFTPGDDASWTSVVAVLGSHDEDGVALLGIVISDLSLITLCGQPSASRRRPRDWRLWFLDLPMT
jgi:hypothetical protein